MTWTDERVEQLKKLWSDGLSASQIAAELGGITRNAVIGKVHRLGLSGRTKAPSTAAPRPRKPRATHMMRVARPVVRGNTALAHSFAYDYEVEVEQAPVENVVPMGQRRTLLELNEQTCRWPIGDGAALLRLSLAHRLSAAGLAARQAAGQPLSFARALRPKRKRPGSNRGVFSFRFGFADRDLQIGI